MLALTLLLTSTTLSFTETKPLVQLVMPDLPSLHTKFRIEPNMGRYAEEVRYVMFTDGGVTLFTDAGMVDSSGIGVVLKNSSNGAFNALGFRCAVRNTAESDGPMYIPHYTKLVRRQVYEGIDAIYDVTPDGDLDVSFFLQPDAKMSDIAMAFQGVEKIEAGKKGDLTLKTITGNVIQKAPRVMRLMGDRYVALPVALRIGADGLVRISGRSPGLGD